MYRDHVPVLNAAARADAEIFRRMVLFAAVSARVPFSRVPVAMADVIKRGAKSGHLWSWKAQTFAYLAQHHEQLHDVVCSETDTARALATITGIPGMGLVKGAFVLQMLGHDVACLDTRNVRREGRDRDAYATHGRRDAAFWRKLEHYINETSGRAQELWDTWCHDVADSNGTTADLVSRMHLCFIPPLLVSRLTLVACPVYRPGGIPGF